MIWPAMRLIGSVGPILPALARKGFKLPALLAIAVPGLLALTALTTFADSSPSPSSSAAPIGDAKAGAAVFAANCAVCHGGSLEGGIGPALNPITTLPGVPNSLDPTVLINTITNGRQHQSGDPGTANMPAWAGKLTDLDIKNVAAYIIEQNGLGGGNTPLSPNELAKRTMLWVGIGIIAMVFVTYLLAQYNMRWIARRAAARRK